MRHRYAILEAPSALGHVPEHLGVERAPGVLLEAGLAEGLDARRAGCLPAGGYSGVPDPRTKVMNPQPLHDYSRSLADRVEAILDHGEFPVVLGGDQRTPIVISNIHDPVHPTVMQGQTVSGTYHDGTRSFTLKGTNSYFTDRMKSKGKL